MERWLGRYSDVGYALFRFVAGFLFACHGAQKLFGALGAEGRQTAPLMLTAGVIEFFGGVLVAIGVLHGARAEQLLADPQQGGAGGPLLLRLPVRHFAAGFGGAIGVLE